MAIKRPIDLGIVDRVSRGIPPARIFAPAETWFGPGEPPPPAAPEAVKGRQYDYPFGVNLQLRPRAGEAVTFEMLRALAQNCDLVRLVIETRKDQLCKLSYTVRPIEGQEKNVAAQEQAAAAYKFLRKPNGVHRWNQWLRMILEDMFVIDAACVYPRPTRGGGLYALEVMDGATIKPVLSDDGRAPLPPAPAYQQILKGLPATDYTAEELIYFPRNPLSWRVYGLPPVEQIILTVNIVLRRQLHLLQYYTEGNLPDALLETPENWSVAQIAEWQQYWDALFAGNTAQRRRGTWVPKGMTPHWTKDAALKDPIDEWYARVVCYCFSVTPQPFITQINRATAETAVEIALEEGLAPIQEWVKDLVDEGLERGGFDLVEFDWEEEVAVKPREQAEIDEILGRQGIKRRSEIRAERGLEDDGIPDFVLTAAGPVLLDGIGNGPVIPEPVSRDTGNRKPETENGLEKIDRKPQTANRKPAVTPIDRDRPEMLRARQEIHGLLLAAFRKDAAAAAEYLAAELGLAKAEKSVISKNTENGKRKTENNLSKIDDDQAAMIERLLAELKLAGIEAAHEEIRAVLARAAVNGGAAALAQIGAKAEYDAALFGQVNKLAQEWAENRAAELVTKISEATRDYLRADVTQAVEEGWSTAQLSQALQENFGFSEGRSNTIARTEIAFADVEGNLMAYRESGLVEGKEWIRGSEEYPCDICEGNDGMVVGLNEAFPSGDQGPPAHPNCVCDVLPVLAAET